MKDETLVSKNAASRETIVVSEQPKNVDADIGTRGNEGSRRSTGRPSQVRLYTTESVGVPDTDAPLTRVEFCRLPRPGQRFPITGLSRSALNDLVLPRAR